MARAGAPFPLALDVTLMEHQGYEFHIEVSTTEAIAGGRYCFVATIMDLRRHHPDGRVELFATPLGQYHGDDADEAESRAADGVERWIQAQQRQS